MLCKCRGAFRAAIAPGLYASTVTHDFSATEDLVGGVREVRFFVKVAGESVPGLVCLPAESPEPMPFVLMQHPGMGSKDDYFVRDIAMAWAKRGWACGGIDAPLHGDRAEHNPMTLFREPDRYPELRAQFAAEVTATLDALAAALPIDLARLGFIGYSLGSMLGIPAVARDGRFKVAAFCLVGEGGIAGSAQGEGSDIAKLAHVAVRIVGKTDDQLIPRVATEALFAALPGEKDLVWLPGGHFEIGPDVVRAAGDWIAARI